MTTALSIPQQQITKYMAFEPGRAEVLRENLGGGGISLFDLPVVKAPPGGATVFTLDTAAGSKYLETITGIMPFTTMTGTLWPSLESTSDSKPVLVTRDMVKARIAFPDTITRDPATGRITAIKGAPDSMVKELSESEDLATGTWNWGTLPYCVFGSGKYGVGKWAKEQRLCYVCTTEMALPVCLRLPPSALAGMRAIMLKCDLLYHNYIWQFSLKKEISKIGKKEFSLVCAKVIGTISTEDAERVATEWKAPLQQQWLSADSSKVAESVSESDNTDG